MKEYIPTIVEEEGNRAYALMLVQILKCPICGKWMLSTEKPFPVYNKLNCNSQMELANWKSKSSINLAWDSYICTDCEKAGRATFKCVMCGKERESSDIQESIGYPPEHLCKICYSSVSAKEWEEKVRNLEELHKYDWE